MHKRIHALSAIAILLLAVPVARPEAMIQYFNTSYTELTHKIPELAEAGYNSIWLPPPTKGSGGLSVGYDLFDRFDLGSKDQRGSVRTRYGTEAELLKLVEMAHRFGIRIYFDNIMNHNAFDIPGYNESTPINLYPGFIAAEDFHLRRTEEGFYRKWDNTRNWQDQWQVQYLGLSDLIDIAHEGGWNGNHGSYEGAQFPKYSGVRHPNNPEYYCYHPTLGYVGFNSPLITQQVLNDNPEFYREDVNAMLIRSARWLMDRTKADGLRLDAVKHVPDYFFGQQYGDKNGSNAGYLGAVQEQFNLSRGFSDWDNHRDSVFDTERARDDAMVFGEHLGQPPGYQGYIDAGMRLVDNDLRNELNRRLGNPWESIAGLDQPGFGGFAPGVAVTHAQSHDNDYAARRELQHATYFTRAGLPLIYTDGNYHAETLGESGGAFPRHANTSFLGQFGDNRMPNILYVHNHFARGSQRSAYSDPDYIAYERLDYREGHGSNTQQVVMLFMMNDNYASGASRPVSTTFPAQGGTSNDAYLYNYSVYGGGFYTYASNLGAQVVPPGGYFVFSYRSPEEADKWKGAGGKPIRFAVNGVAVTNTVKVARRDGPDGDPGYNPRGLPDADPTDYTYFMDVPRISAATNLSFTIHTDGSTENLLLKLDGGIPLNALNHSGGDPRDNPPALSTDTFLGYEQTSFVHRQHREKFAAEVAAAPGNRNIIGSAGSEAWEFTLGTAGVTTYPAAAGTPSNSFTAQYIYHNPRIADAPSTTLQLNPAPENGADVPLDVWVKVGTLVPSDIDTVYLYFTTDHTFPEGMGGFGVGSTRAIPLAWQSNEADGIAWWKGTLPAMPAGTRVRYKVGVFNRNINIASVFPTGASNVDLKKSMMTVFKIDGFNPQAVQYRPHNDYGATATGLKEGLHFLQARAFINRGGGSPFPGASIYNTFSQTFYYDAHTPGGEIKFPQENDTVGGQEYEVVVRADETVTGALFHIDDALTANDDFATGKPFGNGVASNGVGQAWIAATEVTPSGAIASPYPKEFRFKLRNIPSGNTPLAIKVRLLELSSSTNMTLSAAQGHFTELVRNVNANGPETKFYFDWPTTDGTMVGENYRIRVRFSSVLGDGYDDNALRNSFAFEIRPEGDSAGTFQPKSGFLVQRDTGGGLGLWEFSLPDLYSADLPNRLYALLVSQSNQFGVVSTTSVKVRAIPTEPEPFIDIIEPEEVDIIGNRKDIEVTGFPTDQRVRVATDMQASNLWVTVDGSSASITPDMGMATTGGVDRLFWDFTWTIQTSGTFRIVAHMDANGVTNTVEGSDAVNITVKLVQRVPPDAVDLDDDDDGLLDVSETTNPGPPASANSDSWTNQEIHDEWAFGRTPPLGPDSDLDGLPDGLELGYRAPRNPSETDLMADLDNDGWPNFIADLDPPFFNTLDNFNRVPEVSSPSIGGDRRKRVQGTVTDPNNPDTDYDGIPDGVEDANRNGWVDGDGASLPPSFLPWLERDWPDGKLESGDVWTETDPNNPDTDGDSLRDGDEDANKNGSIAGDVNTNRVYDALEEWAETNPLSADTDGDGLPDGWEARYQFDPLDDGIDSLRTLAVNDGLLVNGPDGNPDNDFIVVGGVTNAYTNLQEYNNGTNPREANVGGEVAAGSITIGPGPALGSINGRTYFEEFLDWSADDLVVLDEYESDGFHYQSGDVYSAYDGFDSSRDIVAFYVRDGGDTGAGGDGKVYFRVDFHDLQAFAEEGNLDLYVVVDTGSSGTGERALPDDIDTVSDLRWEAVVAVYDSTHGRVYADTNPVLNSSDYNQDLTAFGVQVRDENHADGFKGAYFNSELDAVEFAISRNALTLPEFASAGWNGINIADLRFHVYTTKDGTANNPRGAGDIGGRSDIRDSIYDDWIAEDYWKAQDSLQSVLGATGFGRNGPNDRGKRAKFALLLHGNQHIKPGNVMQTLINNGAGAGYHRPVEAHALFGQKLNLHLTATLASALQWAKTDPATTNAWRLGATASGPEFNRRIRELVATNTVDLIGTTFSDHMLPYFPADYQGDNIALASELLRGIYGEAPSDRVLWIPERLADGPTLSTIASLGFTHAFIDQSRHVLKWFGRGSSLTEGGYRINRIHGVDCFVINDFASDFLFEVHDKGLPFPLRNLAGKRARAGQQDQLLTLFKPLEAFGTVTKADAYETAVRWLANKPWIEVVSLDDVARGQVDLSQPPDGMGDTFGRIDRGTPSLPKVAQDWVDHATRENYDRWYFGASNPGEEGLAGKRFPETAGVLTPSSYGLVSTGGIARAAWLDVSGIANPSLRRLGRAVLHASTFQTAFHNQNNNDLSKFSTGDYINPDNENAGLAGFSFIAQAQTRKASIFKRVDQWAASLPPAVTAAVEDIDQDGVGEYLLFNQRIFLMFERSGGRMTGAWIRNPDNNQVLQVVGNFASYAGVGDDTEGFPNTTSAAANPDRVGTYRASALKDWWAASGSGGASYADPVYLGSTGSGSVTLATAGGEISKTISLGCVTCVVAQVNYSVSPSITRLYVRNGLSPGLDDLLVNGQGNLAELAVQASTLRLANTNTVTPVAVRLDLGPGVTHNAGAVDDEPGSGVNFHTRPLYNLAQTRQVEISGAGSFGFAMSFETGAADSDLDGMPDWYENQFAFLDRDDDLDAGSDQDLDGVSNHGEYIAGTAPDSFSSKPQVQQVTQLPNGVRIDFPTVAGRTYRVWYRNHSLNTAPGVWTQAAGVQIPGTGGVVTWVDDGTATTPSPTDPALRLRFYRFEVELSSP